MEVNLLFLFLFYSHSIFLPKKNMLFVSEKRATKKNFVNFFQKKKEKSFFLPLELFFFFCLIKKKPDFQLK